MWRWIVLAVTVPRILHAQPEEPTLRFVADPSEGRSVGLGEMVRECGERRIEVDDPYYGRPMAFRAVGLRCALALGFGAAPEALAGEDFSLVALDGYTRPATGAQLAEPGAWLAFADAGLSPAGAAPRFAPITRRALDPAPFYLVWTGAGRNDTHRYPWPFQLATIERAPFERRHPHTRPEGLPPEAAAWRGYALFRSQCVMCHSINGEGGTVGPELNVPQSIVEYRDREQLKRFIRDPQSFRYTTMPAHAHLGDGELSALLAYFDAMSERKHDPRAEAMPAER